MLKLQNNLKHVFKTCLLKTTPIVLINLNKNMQNTHTRVMDIFYTGKTYKWKIKKNRMLCVFNRANKTNIMFKNKNIFKKMSKTKIRFFILKNKHLLDMQIIFKKIRKLNIFTLRGIKIKHAIMYKKKGKISTYKNV